MANGAGEKAGISGQRHQRQSGYGGGRMPVTDLRRRKAAKMAWRRRARGKSIWVGVVGLLGAILALAAPPHSSGCHPSCCAHIIARQTRFRQVSITRAWRAARSARLARSWAASQSALRRISAGVVYRNFSHGSRRNRSRFFLWHPA